MLDRLIEIAHPAVVHPPGGHGSTAVRASLLNYRPPGMEHIRWREDSEIVHQPASLVVTVNVNFMGDSGSATQDTNQQQDFVSVTNFKIHGEDSVTVNISNFNI